jgi:HTH-type transcriptional regulator/antitoxin HipB
VQSRGEAAPEASARGAALSPCGQFKSCKAKKQTIFCIAGNTVQDASSARQADNVMNDFPLRTPGQLSDLLRSFRKASGLTQAEVAVRLGITQQSLSALERNAGRVGAARLMKLLGILGVELVLRMPPEDGADAGKAQW